MAKNRNKQMSQLVKQVNIPLVNKILENAEFDLDEFRLTRNVIQNIGEWALNGNTENEIRRKLDLSKNQWSLLLTICPTLLLVMQYNASMADVIVAGSLFQTAIGGQVIKKQQPMRVRIYNENGRVCGERVEIVHYEEELPPNPTLLRFLATHKLNEKFGNKVENKENYREIIDTLTPEEMAMIKLATEGEEEVLNDK